MKINEITIDESIYPRTEIDPETVARYREVLESGVKLPPLVAMPDGRLLDGRHRLEAYRQLGAETVEVVLESPSDPDARAVELNLRHGRPLTRAELKEAARRWYGRKPVTEIADLLGVSRRTVQNWVADLVAEREEVRADLREQALRMRAEGLTQEEVAEKLGIPRQTISYWENQECQSEKNCSLWHTENSSRVMERESAGAKPAAIKVEADSSSVASVKNLTHATPEQVQGTNQITSSEETGHIPEGDDQESEFPEPDHFPAEPPVPDEEAPARDKDETSGPGLETGRAAAEAFRKKVLPCSDMVKEFFQSLKKASDLAEQLVNRREELLESIAEMQADGMSITILANAVVQACEIYFPRLAEARDVLAEVIKPGIKGMVTKDKFLVLKGGKTNGG
ncbi:MAG TPA: helix-turn-helix domain-containing protein [Desulfotomaculum sp.]|nr:helix-turn-helix domain-containing protein [Desulfotomaculum sp.]